VDRPWIYKRRTGPLDDAWPEGGAIMGGALGTVLASGLTIAVDVRSTFLALISTLFVLLSYRAFVLRFEKPLREK
jgi:hypothetical protein